MRGVRRSDEEDPTHSSQNKVGLLPILNLEDRKKYLSSVSKCAKMGKRCKKKIIQYQGQKVL